MNLKLTVRSESIRDLYRASLTVRRVTGIKGENGDLVIDCLSNLVIDCLSNLVIDCLINLVIDCLSNLATDKHIRQSH